MNFYNSRGIWNRNWRNELGGRRKIGNILNASIFHRYRNNQILLKIMTPEKIKFLIAEELKVEPNLENVYGLNLTKCLIEPIKQKYKGMTEEVESYDLWTVLEESEDQNGYKIYFDEDTNMFGLGMMSDSDYLIDIGNYGTFLKTLYSM